MIRCAFFFALLVSGIHSQTTPPWPGSQITGTIASPTLEFRSQIVSFHPDNPNTEYVTFEGNYPGTATQYADAGYSSFIVAASDRATMTAIYSAITTGRKFAIYYKKGPALFMNRSVMWIRSFVLQN